MRKSILLATIVITVVLTVSSFSSVAHAGPWDDFQTVLQLVQNNDRVGLTNWVSDKLFQNEVSSIIGDVVRTAFEASGYVCFDKPWWLWWLPDGVWYISTCARTAS